MTALWKPTCIERSHMLHFMHAVNKKFQLKNYDELYQWSIDYPEQFWKLLSEFSNIIFHHNASCIMQKNDVMRKTKWFVDATLNFAENLLWRKDDHIALIYANLGVTYLDSFYVINNLAGILNEQEITTYIPYCLLLISIGFLFKISAAPFHF